MEEIEGFRYRAQVNIIWCDKIISLLRVMISLDPGINLQMNLSKIFTTRQVKQYFIGCIYSLHYRECKNVAICNSVVKMGLGLVYLNKKLCVALPTAISLCYLWVERDCTSSHLDRRNLVNKGFIIWLMGKFFSWNMAGSPERAG